VPEETLLGTILAWRLVYYALPALLALIPLARPLAGEITSGGGETLEPAATSPLLARAARAECGVGRQNGARLIHGGTGSAIVARSGQTLTMMFDPLTGGARASQGLIASVSEAARLRMLTPAIYKCTRRLAGTARAIGWRSLRVADEAVVDVAAFSLNGSCHRQLRRKLRHAEKAGIVIEALDRIGARESAELAYIDKGWQEAHGRPRGFSMGMYEANYVANQKVYVARRDGVPMAFVSFHLSRNEFCLDLMRHRGDLPDGTMHLLILAAIEDAKTESIPRLSLAAMPATGVAEPNWVARIRTHVTAKSGGNGLTRFKESFAPRREPLYLCAPNRIALIVALIDLARAIRTAPLPKRNRG
jgi:phosphatidylglycerol lysyltransferase